MPQHMHYDDADVAVIVSSGLFNNDANNNESIFFARQLDYVKSKAYDVKYPANNALALFPVSSEADPGAKTITYESYDMVGMAKIIANYADDLPRADVKGTETTIKVFGVGVSYGYSTQDIRAARMAGKPLTTRRAEAARRSHDNKINKLVFWGDEEYGIYGVLNHPNIPQYVLPEDGTGTSSKFEDKTAEQIIRDLNAAVSSIVEVTKGVEIPDTMLMPIKQYNQITGMLMPDSSGKTVLKFFEDNNPYIKSIKPVQELAGALDGEDVMIIYRNNIDALSIEIPMPFTQYAPQRENLEFKVPCESRVAGLMLYYPLSMCLVPGI